MKQTASTVVRDDGVAGSNPATPTSSALNPAQQRAELRLCSHTRRLKKLEAWAQKLVDRNHRIDTRVLLHRLQQCIAAGESIKERNEDE